MIQSIQAKTRKITCSFTLHDTVDLSSLGCSFDLEKQILDILAYEMFLETPDEHKQINIELEEYYE